MSMGKKAPGRGKCMQGWSTGSVGAPEHASVAHQKLILVFGVRTELPEASGGGSGVAGAPALQETLQSSRPVLRRGRYPHQPSRATGTAWTRGASVYVPAKINTILPTRRASIRRRFGDRQ